MSHSLIRSLAFSCLIASAAVARAQMSPEDALDKLREKQRMAATQPAAQPAGTQPTAARPATSAAKTNPAEFLEEQHPGGKLKARYALGPNGAKSGVYTLWSEDGKKIEVGNYRNNVLDGQRQTFHPNGKVHRQENYRKGELDGVAVEFDDKGNKVRMAEYRAGAPTRDGAFKNGVPVSDRVFVDGLLVYPRSPAMIVQELKRIRQMKIETVPAAQGVPAHEGGNEAQEDREAAVRLLMEYRYLCYAPYEGMALDALYNAHAEAAVGLLNVIGRLEHTPANPGWPNDRYKFAYEGTSHSNLYFASGRGARGGARGLCEASIHGYMNDSDAGNINVVGHRRWCLNPRMGKTGFAAQKTFSAMWSMDTSRQDVGEIDFIAYPGPGPFPSTHFGRNHAWSISLGDQKYAPAEKSVKITVTPVQVQVAQNKIEPLGKPLELNHFTISQRNFGMGNCIIFRPANLSTDAGKAYLVDVQGLAARGGGARGGAESLRYVVEFFNPAE